MKFIAKIFAAFAALQGALLPCGPFFEKSPMVDAEGNSRTYAERMREPGVVLPTFKADYLSLLYLPLSGVRYDNRALALAAATGGGDDSDSHALEDWYMAREAAFPGLKPQKITPYRSAADYSYATNCQPDAFRYARELLKTRAKRPHGKFWLQNQDTVFANCGERAGELTEPPKDAPAAVVSDFRYQQAAWHFYRSDFSKAYAAFEAIAQSTSMHRDVARYMLGRTLLRHTGVIPYFGKAEEETPDTQTVIEKAIAEITDPAMKANTRALKNLLSARRDEKLYAQNLVGELSTGNPVLVAQEFRYLVRKWQYQGAGKIEAMVPGNDLIEWLLNFQSTDKVALGVAEKKYKEGKKSHWLLAVLSKLNTSSAQLDFWLTEAGRIGEEHPAFIAVGFYRLALRFDARLADKIRQKLEAAKDTAALNALRAVYFRHAPNLTAVAEVMERKLLTLNGQKPDHEYGFDSDAARFLTEYASLADYQELLKSKVLSKPGRLEIARAGWVRSVLLNDQARSVFATYLSENDPALKAALNDEPLLVLLRNPGLAPYISGHHGRRGTTTEIDSFRENWWCRLGASDKENTGWDHYRMYSGLEETFFTQLYPVALTSPFAFGSGGKEYARLKGTGNAAEYFSKHLFAEAEKKERAPWLYEGLHRLVKVTRYGCEFEGKGKISFKAFKILHRLSPYSEWAQKTPYWFR